MALWEQEGRSATWRHLKKKLRDAFKEKHEEERRHLLMVRARQTGTLEDYIAEYTGLCLSPIIMLPLPAYAQEHISRMQGVPGLKSW